MLLPIWQVIGPLTGRVGCVDRFGDGRGFGGVWFVDCRMAVMGFKKIFFPEHNAQTLNSKVFKTIELIPVAKVDQVFGLLFG